MAAPTVVERVVARRHSRKKLSARASKRSDVCMVRLPVTPETYFRCQGWSQVDEWATWYLLVVHGSPLNAAHTGGVATAHREVGGRGRRPRRGPFRPGPTPPAAGPGGRRWPACRWGGRRTGWGVAPVGPHNTLGMQTIMAGSGRR